MVHRWVRTSTALGGALERVVRGTITYDGHMDFSVTLTAMASVTSANFTLGVPVAKDLVRFAVGSGMGGDGGYFPTSNLSKLDWRWPAPESAEHHDDISRNGGVSFGVHAGVGAGWRVWLGDANAGVYLKLKGREVAWNRHVWLSRRVGVQADLEHPGGVRTRVHCLLSGKVEVMSFLTRGPMEGRVACALRRRLPYSPAPAHERRW